MFLRLKSVYFYLFMETFQTQQYSSWVWIFFSYIFIQIELFRSNEWTSSLFVDTSTGPSVHKAWMRRRIDGASSTSCTIYTTFCVSDFYAFDTIAWVQASWRLTRIFLIRGAFPVATTVSIWCAIVFMHWHTSFFTASYFALITITAIKRTSFLFWNWIVIPWLGKCLDCCSHILYTFCITFEKYAYGWSSAGYRLISRTARDRSGYCCNRNLVKKIE